jgi:superfamily II DNA/RNA helicase
MKFFLFPCSLITDLSTQGLDIADIETVVQYGITQDVPTTLQRGGRGGRTPSTEALFLIMYEPWVLDIDLLNLEENSSDPDFPYAGKLTKYSTKPAQTGVAMVRVVESKELCIRGFWADYLKDDSSTGE